MHIDFSHPVILCGDIHGSPGNILEKIESIDIRDVDIIILGDIGIWRYRDYRGKFALFDKALAERNINCYVMRGNHDNPIFFRQPGTHKEVDRFWSKFNNFKLLPDFTTMTYNDKTGIAIGGGLSVDRSVRSSFYKHRKPQFKFSYRNDDWWPDEILQLPPDLAENHYDFILSHNGPCPPCLTHQSPIIAGYKLRDKNLINDLNAEQQKYEALADLYTPDKWFMGHYHLSYMFQYKNIECRVLNEFELKEFR